MVGPVEEQSYGRHGERPGDISGDAGERVHDQRDADARQGLQMACCAHPN